MRRLALISLPFAMLASAASAQIAGTMETKAYPNTADGKRFGCSIQFRTAVQDFSYRGGATVVVSGSMGFMNYPGKQPSVTLKVVLNDMSPDGSTIDKNTAPPTNISLVGIDNESNAPAQLMSAEGEDPGSRIAAFTIDGFDGVIRRILERKELAVLFNRRAGGNDVRVLSDLTILDRDDQGQPIRGNQTVAAFADCSVKIIEEMRVANGAK